MNCPALLSALSQHPFGPVWTEDVNSCLMYTLALERVWQDRTEGHCVVGVLVGSCSEP